MNIVFVPRYEESLSNGRLFEVSEYRPKKHPYGVDRPAYSQVKKKFENKGHDVYTSDQIPLSDVDVAVFIDLEPTFDTLLELSRLDCDPYLLYIMREPPAVARYNNSVDLIRFSRIFDSVLTWNDSLAQTKSSFYHYYLPWNIYDTVGSGDGGKIASSRRKLLTNVSTNRSSSHTNELYSERKHVIEYYENNHQDMFSLFGKGWEKEDYDVYHGTPGPDAKTEPYRSHRFALCFENMTGINGWITEKIFDCFRHGIVPVYWGANDVQKYIPQEAFIDYRECSTPEELHNQLIEMDPDEYQEMKRVGREFMINDGRFTPDRYSSRLLEVIERGHTNGKKGVCVGEVNKIKGQMIRKHGGVHFVSSFDSMSRKQRINVVLKEMYTNPSAVFMRPDKMLRWFYRTIRS